MVLRRFIFPFYYHLNAIKVKSKAGSVVWAYLRLIVECLQMLHYVLSPNSTLPWPLTHKVIDTLSDHMRSKGMNETTAAYIMDKEKEYVMATDQVALTKISEYVTITFPFKLSSPENALNIVVAIMTIYSLFVFAGMYLVKKQHSLQFLGSVRHIYCGVISWVSSILYMPLIDTLLAGTLQPGHEGSYTAACIIFLPVVITFGYFFLISEAKCSLSSVYLSARTNSIVDMWLFIARTVMPFIHIFMEQSSPVVAVGIIHEWILH
jgi:hypothetical protein